MSEKISFAIVSVGMLVVGVLFYSNIGKIDKSLSSKYTKGVSVNKYIYIQKHVDDLSINKVYR
jgi:hypothetical protein